jgi:hypothetical protein
VGDNLIGGGRFERAGDVGMGNMGFGVFDLGLCGHAGALGVVGGGQRTTRQLQKATEGEKTQRIVACWRELACRVSKKQ